MQFKKVTQQQAASQSGEPSCLREMNRQEARYTGNFSLEFTCLLN
jgi:hypothetical protein